MRHHEGTFSGKNQVQLYFQSWHPDGKSQAVVALVHGFGEHCGRYKHVARAFTKRHFAVYGFDLRGHGRSPEPRGHIDSMQDYREDVRAYLQMIALNEPDLPLYLMGHSMGGLIVLDYGLHAPDNLAGVIASAPHLADPPVSGVIVQLAKVMSRIWPTFSQDAGLDVNAISRNQNVVQAYTDDPLVHGRGTARLSTELSTAVAQTQANAPDFQPPLLIIHGDADRLTSPVASRRFFDAVQSPAKTYIAYAGGYHELHNDIHQERVLTELGQWLEYQLQQTKKHTENNE